MSLGKDWHQEKTQTLRVAGISISNPYRSEFSKVLENDSVTVSCNASLPGAAARVFISTIKLSPLIHTVVVIDS